MTPRSWPGECAPELGMQTVPSLNIAYTEVGAGSRDTSRLLQLQLRQTDMLKASLHPCNMRCCARPPHTCLCRVAAVWWCSAWISALMCCRVMVAASRCDASCLRPTAAFKCRSRGAQNCAADGCAPCCLHLVAGADLLAVLVCGCCREKGYVTADVAAAEKLTQLSLSGTKFRKMLRAGRGHSLSGLPSRAWWRCCARATQEEEEANRLMKPCCCRS